MASTGITFCPIIMHVVCIENIIARVRVLHVVQTHNSYTCTYVQYCDNHHVNVALM